MHPHIELFIKTFNLSTISDFQKFMNPFKAMGVTKWIICSDYCIGDKKKFYDSMTFTLIPYVLTLEEIQALINKIAPTDLKKTQSIDERFTIFLKSGLTFSFSFRFQKGKKNFFLKADMPQYIEDMGLLKDQYQKWIITTPQNKIYYETVIKKINKLKQEMKRPNFNKKLFQNIIIVQMLVAYIMVTLKKETDCNIEIISWLSDRDKIVDSYDSIAYDMAYSSFHELCTRMDLNTQTITERFLISSTDGSSNRLWFDEMLRIPDLITGATAGRNYSPENKDKYDIIFEEVFAANDYLSIIDCTRKNNVGRLHVLKKS